MGFPGNFLERDLEEMVFTNKNVVHERGFIRFFKNTCRQMKLPNGLIMDLFSWEYDSEKDWLRCKIVEIKRDSIDIQAFCQIVKYWEQLSEMSPLCSKTEVDLILLGSNIDNLVHSFLFLDTQVRVFSYHFDYDGLKFEDWTPKGSHFFPYIYERGVAFLTPNEQTTSFFDFLKTYHSS